MASRTAIAIGIIIIVIVIAGGSYLYFSGMMGTSPPPPVTNYSLTIQPLTGNGTTTPAIGSHSYASGTIVQVTATPASGWTFDHWVLDGTSSGSASPFPVTMSASHTLQAVFVKSSGPPTTLTITIYGGEASATNYGFGLTPTTLKSPGTTLNFTVGQTVNLTFKNVGQFPHAFVIKAANDPNSVTEWGAAVGSASAPLTPGQSGTVTFTPTQAWTYYYLCPVPGHDQLGMWGKVVVS